MRKKMKKKLSPYSSILIVEMVISLLEASLGNDQPRSVTKPLQSGSGLTILLVSSDSYFSLKQFLDVRMEIYGVVRKSNKDI